MASNRPVTLEQSLTTMEKWPEEWAIEASDHEVGRAFVETLVPFVRHLHESGLSPSAIRRHMNELGILGSELIRDRHMESPPGALPPLSKLVDDEGGPLLHHMDEQWQRSFDATCRALNRFPTRPAGRAVVSPRRRTKRSRPATATLDAMIAKATAGALDRDEAIMGFLDRLDRHLRPPIDCLVPGLSVTVTGFSFGDDGAIVACCQHHRANQRIPILDLPVPTPPPVGHAWIAAYPRWCRERTMTRRRIGR
jgi:hypothetical protein